MGVDIIPQQAWTTTLDVVREYCPEEVAAVEATGVRWDVVAFWYDYQTSLADALDSVGEDPDFAAGVDERLGAAWVDLQKAFEVRTGLGLGLVYYNESEYGEIDVPNVDGAIFTVDGVVDLTPAGRSMQGKVRDSVWVIVA